MNDCEAMANYAGTVARYGDPAIFFESFGVFFASQVGGYYNDYVELQTPGRDSGYRGAFQDGNNARNDQGHHFAAFIRVGAGLADQPPLQALMSAFVFSVTFEVGTGQANNIGDVRLGTAAAWLGYNIQRDIRNGSFQPDRVSGTILKEFCGK
jgi:hypothetical protein